MIPAFIGGLGAPELLLILALVLILFGAGRLPQVFSQLGKAMKNFRDAQRDGADALDADPPQLGSSVTDAEELRERERERERA